MVTILDRKLRGAFRSTLLFALLALAGAPGLATAAEPDAKPMKFEIYKDKAEEFRWRLKSSNGEILATPGQGYKSMGDAKAGIELVMKSGDNDKLKYEVYGDDKKEYRWRLKAGNGQIVAAASESYRKKADADKAVDSIRATVAKAEVVSVKE